MKNSAKISKARTTAGVKRKYDLVITSANPNLSPDGQPVVSHVFDTISKLAPALSIGKNFGENKVASSDVRHSFNLIVILTVDALKCNELLDEIRNSLESEGNLLIVHHLVSCPDFEA